MWQYANATGIGLIVQHIHMGLYPVYLGIFTILMLVMTELLNKKVRSLHGVDF